MNFGVNDSKGNEAEGEDLDAYLENSNQLLR
jgi:hypothetical protein